MDFEFSSAPPCRTAYAGPYKSEREAKELIGREGRTHRGTREWPQLRANHVRESCDGCTGRLVVGRSPKARRRLRFLEEAIDHSHLGCKPHWSVVGQKIQLVGTPLIGTAA